MNTTALFNGDPNGLSDTFMVTPGHVCVLSATGFSDEVARPDNSTFKRDQVVCVRRLVAQSDPKAGTKASDPMHCHRCVDDLGAIITVTIMSSDIVMRDGECWHLSADNNLGVIGLPGSYQLEMNDLAAIDDIQVYAQFFRTEDLPPAMNGLFF